MHCIDFGLLKNLIFWTDQICSKKQIYSYHQGGLGKGLSNVKVPEEIHVHGNGITTVIEDPSVNWSETSMEPHFPELCTFDLKCAVIKCPVPCKRVYRKLFDLISKAIASGLKILLE